MQQAQRYFAGVLVGMLTAACLWTTLVLAEAGGPTETSRWIYEALTIKEAAAMAARAPRIFVVGGSNVHFSLRAALIASATGRGAVNMGLYAQLGLRYLLTTVKPLLQRGDTVILAPEYELYADSGVPNYVLLDYVLARDPGYLRSLGVFGALRMSMYVPPQRLTLGLQARVHTPAAASAGYESATIERSYGDETSNTVANQGLQQRQNLDDTAAPSTTLLQGIPADSEAWGVLRDFTAWARGNGVQVLATYPSTMWFDAYAEAPAQTTLQQIANFYAGVGVPVLGVPRDFMYDKSWFFDTPYHLLDAGARVRTERLIELGAAYF